MKPSSIPRTPFLPPDRDVRRRLLGAAAAMGVAALAGCAAPTGLLQPLPSGLPAAVDLEASVPFFPQTDYECGPAALATLLGTVGVEVAPATLTRQVFLPARQGSLQLEMIGGARRHGAVATRLPPTLSALLREVAAGRPVVVLQNLGLDLAPVWHYAVLVAYSLETREVVLRSGIVRRFPLPMPLFENTWARAGSWAVALTRPGAWPVSADEAAVAEAAIGFERVAPAESAFRAYASAVQRWPDSLTLAMGLGNTAYAAGRRVLAADAFQTAARRHRSAPAWINLSRTLLAAGRVEPAWRAALEAEYLDDPAFRAETTALLREVGARR